MREGERLVSGLCLCVAALATTPARAQSAGHSPPTLPHLLHARPNVRFDHTFAYLAGPEDDQSIPGSLTWVGHTDFEVPFAKNRWYAGAAWETSSLENEGDRVFVMGNPELFLRGVWSDRKGLSAGGSLGTVIPLPEQLDQTRQQGLGTARALRPWEGAYFTSTTFTLRPAFDIRLRAFPFVFQLRQGLDWGFDFERSRGDFLARTNILLGVTPVREWIINLELIEAYALTQEVPDDRRAAFVIAPSTSFRFGKVEPGLGVFFPVGTPLGGVAASFIAVRGFLSLEL